MTGERETRPPRGRTPPAMRFMVGPQTFEKTGLSRFDLRDPYHFAVSLSWPRFFLLFVAVELAINTGFAVLYALQPAAIANQQTPGFVSAFFFSLETLATVGYGEMFPATLYGHVVASVEIVTGVIFMAITTGLVFVRFSKPRAKIIYAAHAVVAQHNGQPTLMLRIGNARRSLLLDTQARLYTLVRSVSAEGWRSASIVELPLVRERQPAFAIMWTLMHVIDDASPLRDFPDGHEDLAQLRLFLTIEAYDPAIGQKVSDLHNLTGANIRFAHRYVDAIEARDDGAVRADFGRLSTIEPDAAGPPPMA